MFSSLSKLADRNFIVGFLIPTISFSIAILSLFTDIPAAHSLIENIASADAIEKLIYVIFGLWLASIILLILNKTVFQVAEGYLPPTKWKKKWRKNFNDKFDALTEDIEARAKAWNAEGDQYPVTLKAEFDRQQRTLVTYFPSEKHLVLPTKLGNAIRAFEDYSRDVYGADSIALWYHLSVLLPKAFQSSLEYARAEVNCLLNFMILSLVVAISALVRLILVITLQLRSSADSVTLFSDGNFWKFLLFFVLSLLFSRVAYLLAVDRAIAWGSLVKAAFDCYLPRLAHQLGFALPDDENDRKEFWKAISRRSIYNRPLELNRWPKTKFKDNEDGSADREST